MMRKEILMVILLGIMAILATAHVVNTSSIGLGESMVLIHQKNILESGSWFSDDLVVGSRAMPFSIVPLIFWMLSSILGEVLVLLLFRLLIPLAVLAGMAEILKQSGMQVKKREIILLMIVCSPTLIFAGIADSQLMLILAIQLWGAVALSKKHGVVGTCFFAIAATEGLVQILTSMLLIWILFENKILKKSMTLAAFLANTIVGAVVLGWSAMRDQKISLVQTSQGVHGFLLELGGEGALSIVVLGLALLGMVVLYKRRYFFYSVVMLAVIASVFWVPAMRVYGAIVAAILAGLFIDYMTDYRWRLKQLRPLSFAAIGIGIGFSVMLVSTQVILAAPDAAQMDALAFMSGSIPEDAVVLAMPENGIFIEAVAKRQVIVDTMTATLPDAQIRQEEVLGILGEVYMANAKEILDRYGVTHIYLTPSDTRNRQIDGPEGGLLYLLQNNETFKNVYDDKGHMVWEYLTLDR